MKKAFAVFTLLLGLMAMFAQSGPTFPYQAVVRNSQNQLIKDSTFAIGVEVYQGADLKYSETQSVTTNANGQFTMNIGGGTVVNGAMNDVTDWSVAKFKLTYHLSEGDIVSENAVNPVPYALQAANVAESAGLDCADVKTCIADTLTHYTTTTALEQLLQQISARMDSLDHIVDSLSHQPCGASFTCGTDSVKDIDNNWYHTVPFGNQCWLKENLRTTKYADNTPIENGTSSSTDTPYWYYPNNDASNKSSYGLLYNWKAVMNGASTTNDNPSGVQGICPSGWHVPSDAEWTQLTRFVKSQPAYVCAGCSGSDNDSFTYCIAKALASTTGWVSYSETCVVGDTTRSNNATGFSAMPAGCYDGAYSLFSSYTCFWSTTEDFNSYSYGRAILTYHNYVDRQFYNEASGFSVRCVRNADAGGNTPATPPTMSCEDVMNCLGDTLGNLNAQIESQGTEIQTLNATVASQGETIAAQGAEIETLNSTVTTQGETIAAQGNTIDSLNHVVDSLSNLNHGGGPAAFTCGTSKVKDVENNEYNTVRIGSQCWMAQNLRTKTHQYGNVWTKTDVDSTIYGRYYDWAAVMQGESGNTVQGICPTGWHVPSDVEWDTLTTYVNSVADYKCEGTNNYIAKALASKTGWNASGNSCAVGNNLEHNNATGFSVVPSGYYSSNNATCFNFGDYAFLWSATEGESGKVLCRVLNKGNFQVQSTNEEKNYGYSVRCVRDADTGGDTPATPATMSCEDVIECMGDTLGRLNAKIENLQNTVAKQDSTINALNNQVNPPFTCGTSKVKDVENNEYNTVRIGSQCWMAQNLRTKTHQYGNVWTKTDADSAIYGRYYDWAAVMQGESGSTVQGICPAGWHVPSDAEWDTLTTYVSSVEAYKCNSSIASALSDSTGWESSSICCAGDNSSATINITGFAAVPAGSFTDGFGGFGSDAYFWSATEYNNQMALCQSLHSHATGVSSYEDYKSHCYSVRCVRNADAGGDTPATPPTMSCEDVMNCLGDTLDRLNARITSQSAEIETLNGTVTSQANTIDSLTHIVNSLSDPTPDTPAGDTTAVPFNCGTDKLKDVDSNEYSTIKIGNQCWMKENLRTVTSHCGRVMNANDICLYDWAAAMQVSEANATTITVGVKHQGICPAGWHVPSDADWDALTSYVYNSTNPDYKCSGCDQRVWEQDTRCIAKALSSTTGWNTSSNSCAVGNSPEDNDATGFSAVPAGAYYGESFGVTNVGTGAYMWSSTQKGDGSAWYRLLGCGNSRVVRSSSNKGICYSVRCLKNN